jgi:hypothetical protein
MKLIAFSAVVGLALAGGTAHACELCAIYTATTARGESSGGFLFTISEQFIPYRTPQFYGKEVHPVNPDFLDSSITHLVPSYNFSPRLGVSLSLPLNYRDFQRTDVRYSLSGPPVLETQRGTELDLGDIALIGRATVFQKTEMRWGVVLNLLGGVKFPTGDTSHLQDEVEQSRIFESLLPPNTPHDPLGHSISSVHQHDLSPGSGSYDGIFGLTLNARWQRLLFNSQFQYYLRTEGESGFHYGDELMISGGPGGYLLLTRACTLSLQANAVYDTTGRDELLGRVSDRTGSTAWYLGPQLGFTWLAHFSANAGVDIPLHITNNGFQNVPNYRVHAGVAWRF